MSEIEAEGEVERQRLRAERLLSALAAVSAADLKTLLDDELGQALAGLGRVLTEAQAEQKARG